MIPDVGKQGENDSARIESLATEFTLGRSTRDGEGFGAQLGKADSTLEIVTKPVTRGDSLLRSSCSPGLSSGESVSPVRCSIQSRSPSVPRPPSIFKQHLPKPVISSLHPSIKYSSPPQISTIHPDSSFSLYPDYPHRPGTSADVRPLDPISLKKLQFDSRLPVQAETRPGTAAVGGYKAVGRGLKLANFMPRQQRIVVFSSVNVTPVGRKKLSISDLC